MRGAATSSPGRQAGGQAGSQGVIRRWMRRRTRPHPHAYTSAAAGLGRRTALQARTPVPQAPEPAHPPLRYWAGSSSSAEMKAVNTASRSASGRPPRIWSKMLTMPRAVTWREEAGGGGCRPGCGSDCLQAATSCAPHLVPARGLLACWAGTGCQAVWQFEYRADRPIQRTSLYWYCRFQRNRCCCTSSSCARHAGDGTQGDWTHRLASRTQTCGLPTRRQPAALQQPQHNPLPTRTTRTCTTVE